MNMSFYTVRELRKGHIIEPLQSFRDNILPTLSNPICLRVLLTFALLSNMTLTGQNEGMNPSSKGWKRGNNGLVSVIVQMVDGLEKYL